MKKACVIVFFICFGTHLIPAQTITVHSPAPGVTWYKGETKTISWTASGCSDPDIKINIFRNSISQANFVEQLTCTGCSSKNWTIPGSYAAGNYQIRVKTADNVCMGDSGVFEIAEKLTFAPIKVEAALIKSPDLKISIIPNPESPLIYQNTAVKFKVENIGGARSVPTSLRVYMGQTMTDQWPVPALDPNRSYSLTKKLNPEGVGYILWGGFVDEEKVNNDLNRTNNSAHFKMTVRGPDLKVINVSTPDYKKTIGAKCILRITVKNIGEAPSGYFEVDCDWKPCPGIAQGRKYKTHAGLAPGETVTFEFSHRYSCFGMKYPDLIIDKDNKVKEENEGNNSGSMAFHISGENITGSSPRSVNY